MRETKLIIISLCLVLTGCFGPATRQAPLDEAELRRETEYQEQLAKNTKKKNIKERKYKDINVYRNRLNRVGNPILKAAQKICPKSSCNYNLKVEDQKVLNAWADGKNVTFTPIMMDFLDTDKELATVVGHEIAHNMMSHSVKTTGNVLAGAVVDILIKETTDTDTFGAGAVTAGLMYSKSFEREADYVGVYLMANAGYDIGNINNLWRKMSVESPDSIQGSFFSTHPSNPERYLRLRESIKEVQSKKSQGLPLIPNYR